MEVLGLNAFHADASAALIRDNQVIAAAEEERFNRIKHSAGFPTESIRYCLSQGGLDIRKLDLIAVASQPIENVREEILQILSGRPAYSRQIKKRLSAVAKFRDVRRILAQEFKVSVDSLPPVIEVPHQVAHVASAYFASGFAAQEGQTALLSLDTFGDFCSTLLAVGEGNNITDIEQVLFPHSIGILYTMVTQYCGFNKFGDEGKLMGLAAYGEPIYADRLRQIIDLHIDGLFELDPDFFTHPVYGMDMIWESSQPIIEEVFSEKMIEYFGPPRHRYSKITVRERDMAASLQLVTEEAILHVLTALKTKVPATRLCLAGNIILNCLANKTIFQKSGFEEVYIASAPHDAGTAIGCAFQAVAQNAPGIQFAEKIRTTRFGPSFTPQEIEQAFLTSGLRYERSEKLVDEVVQALAEGKVVAWFKGRMEFGPRALGGRSILADPRNPEMRSIINARVKFREDYRPFAASILEEDHFEFFPESAISDFMLYAFPVAESKRELIPACVHQDGTCRIHTVNEAVDPDYHALIKAFKAKTGLPLLLNTSFNENDPMVRTPEEAINVFNSTNIDVLVVDDFIVRR